MKVKTMDGEEVGFRENYVEWLCETGESTPVPIETFATHEGAYVQFIPQKEWDHSVIKEAKEKGLANFDRFMSFMAIKDNKTESFGNSGWIVTERIRKGKKDCKARLFVHGNEIVDNIKTDCPTASKISL